MELIRFQPRDLDTVYAIQQAAYAPLYKKYRDDDTNPSMESRKKHRPMGGVFYFLSVLPNK